MRAGFIRAFNWYMDKLVRPEVTLRTINRSMFEVCGYTGLALAVILALALVWLRGLSSWVMVGIVVIAGLTFLGLAMVTKIITGEEYLVYYHHELAVLSMVGLSLWLLGQPVLAYLDITLMGVGAFLMCGRMGCLMVGCCHGRPHSWGVRYREEHAAAGFADYLVGVRLFPMQAVESLFVGLVVLVGTWLVASGRPPGTALAWYVVAYDLGRFSFEFMRGDTGRPYYGGFSEAQWLSLVLTWLVVITEILGILPWQPWHASAALLLALTMLVVKIAGRRCKTAKHLLLHPSHVAEIARVLEPKTVTPEVTVQTTSLGVQIGVSQLQEDGAITYHYSLSARDGQMGEATARTLADLIIRLRHAAHTSEFVVGQQSIYHLLLHPGSRSAESLGALA